MSDLEDHMAEERGVSVSSVSIVHDAVLLSSQRLWDLSYQKREKRSTGK